MVEPRCPKCSAPRGDSSECPHCGIIYAKANLTKNKEEIKRVGDVSLVRAVKTSQPGCEWNEAQEDEVREFWLRIFAVPLALLVSWLLVKSSVGHVLVRVFFSMWIHELGHAITAWFCGFMAIPGPWFTSVMEGRSVTVGVLLLGGLVCLFMRSYLRAKWMFVITAIILLVIQFYFTIVISLQKAREWIVFGGDAGNMALGVLLMISFYANSKSSIRTGWTRWGYLIIGAISYMDAFEQWWASRSDPERIPYGENQGSGLSDPSKLVESFGWNQNQMINAYVTLASLCFLLLIAAYLWGLWNAREMIKKQIVSSGS
jgi:hypothetical protein